MPHYLKEMPKVLPLTCSDSRLTNHKLQGCSKPKKNRTGKEKAPEEDVATGVNDETVGSSIDDPCELLRSGCLMEARKLVFSPAALKMLDNCAILYSFILKYFTELLQQGLGGKAPFPL